MYNIYCVQIYFKPTFNLYIVYGFSTLCKGSSYTVHYLLCTYNCTASLQYTVLGILVYRTLSTVYNCIASLRYTEQRLLVYRTLSTVHKCTESLQYTVQRLLVYRTLATVYNCTESLQVSCTLDRAQVHCANI